MFLGSITDAVAQYAQQGVCNGRVSVCLSVFPSVRLSHRSTTAAACGGFAAERHVGRRYRSTAAGAVQQTPALGSNGATARRSAANASSVTVDSRRTEEAGNQPRLVVVVTGNESAPIQLAQCRFPGLAISNAKILIYFSNKI